jgi:hypothetical protein
MHYALLYMYPSSNIQVVSINISRCQNKTSVSTCEDCVGLQDPYCAWSSTDQKCVYADAYQYGRNTNINPGEAQNNQRYRLQHQTQLIQDIGEGTKSKCPRPKKSYINVTKETVIERKFHKYV